MLILSLPSSSRTVCAPTYSQLLIPQHLAASHLLRNSPPPGVDSEFQLFAIPPRIKAQVLTVAYKALSDLPPPSCLPFAPSAPATRASSLLRPTGTAQGQHSLLPWPGTLFPVFRWLAPPLLKVFIQLSLPWTELCPVLLTQIPVLKALTPSMMAFGNRALVGN